MFIDAKFIDFVKGLVVVYSVCKFEPCTKYVYLLIGLCEAYCFSVKNPNFSTICYVVIIEIVMLKYYN